MQKLKTIWLPPGKKVYVWQGLISTDRGAYDQLIAVSPNNANARNAGTAKQDAFLLQEIDANNNWARLGAKLYFGWFVVILTLNALATGWLFTYRGARPPYARLVFLLFVGMNLAGTIATYFIRNHMYACDRRIREVLAGLEPDPASKPSYAVPQSPVPRPVINVMFAFTGVTFFMLFLFWLILEIWPHVFLA